MLDAVIPLKINILTSILRQRGILSLSLLNLMKIGAGVISIEPIFAKESRKGVAELGELLCA